MPVSWLNFLASAVSRLFPSPTESPTNVIFCPPYFFLIAAAFGTFGAAIAAAWCVRAGLLLLAAATLREATSAIAPTTPARTSSLRCFTLPRPFQLDPSWTHEGNVAGRREWCQEEKYRACRSFQRPRGSRAGEPARRAFRRRIAFVWSCETRDSVTPSTSPISRRVSSS